MLVVKKKRGGIAYKYVWFADKPTLAQAFGFAIFAQCKYGQPLPGFSRRKFLTRMVDLQDSAEVILKNMSRRTAFDVKRAKREGVVVEEVKDMAEFLAFYNAFAAGKGMSTVTAGELANWGSNTVALAARIDGVAVAMHSYIVDPQDGRGRLLHSGSVFRQMASNEERSAIGRANRLLHYEAMLAFKAQGLTRYDMGGYAKDSPDPQLANIAKFKETLGGQEAREDHYISLPLLVLQSIAALTASARHLLSVRMAALWPRRSTALEPASPAQGSPS